jgi:hypothetical protein
MNINLGGLREVPKRRDYLSGFIWKLPERLPLAPHVRAKQCNWTGTSSTTFLVGIEFTAMSHTICKTWKRLSTGPLINT